MWFYIRSRAYMTYGVAGSEESRANTPVDLAASTVGTSAEARDLIYEGPQCKLQHTLLSYIGSVCRPEHTCRMKLFFLKT